MSNLKMPYTMLKRNPFSESTGRTTLNPFVMNRGTIKKSRMPKQRARAKVSPMAQGDGAFSSSEKAWFAEKLRASIPNTRAEIKVKPPLIRGTLKKKDFSEKKESPFR